MFAQVVKGETASNSDWTLAKQPVGTSIKKFQKACTPTRSMSSPHVGQGAGDFSCLAVNKRQASKKMRLHSQCIHGNIASIGLCPQCVPWCRKSSQVLKLPRACRRLAELAGPVIPKLEAEPTCYKPKYILGARLTLLCGRFGVDKVIGEASDIVQVSGGRDTELVSST